MGNQGTDLCASKTCPEGQHCDSATGDCMENPSTDLCASKTCPAGQFCNSATGNCEDKAEIPECNPACDEDHVCSSGVCIEKGDGEACDPETFVERCDGDTAVYCSLNKVTTSPCNAGNMCQIVKGSNWSRCYSKDLYCHQGDQPSQPCYFDTFFDEYYLRTSDCVETESGAYIWNEREGDRKWCGPTYSCANGTCSKIIADEGSTCNSDTFPQRCESGIAVYCQDGKVTGRKCTSKEVCDNLTNFDFYWCFVPESCATEYEGATAKQCDGQGLITSTCFQTEHNGLAWISKRETCLYYCNPATLKCLP